MQYLGLLATIGELFIAFWGLSLIAGFFVHDRWLAVAAGPWLAVSLLFFIESYHGLGNLHAFGAGTTLLSLLLIGLSASVGWQMRLRAPWQQRAVEWSNRFGPRQMLPCGLIFAVIFGYAFAWRFAFPDVDGSSEKIADLSYICSYLPGGKIPVADAWLHPYLSTQYYSFQHYAAALLGRSFGLAPGSTYNFAFCCLVGFVGTTFAGGVFLMTKRRYICWLVVFAFVFGGTGATALVHLTDKTVNAWSAMRYIGSAPYDKAPVGPLLKAYASKYPVMDLPGEPFSYSIYLGDYHAPLSGFYLLSLGVLAVLLWHKTQGRRYAALLGGTLTWSILANSWSLPLQGLAIGAWVLANRREWRKIVPWLILGAVAVWFSANVYLDAFTAASAGYKTAFKLVARDEHTPPLLFILFLFPTIGLALLGLCSGNRMGIWLGAVSAGFLLFSEFFYVDDIYSGMYERFNTTLKWWPWIVAGTLLTLGPVLIEQSRRRWVRIAALFCCAYPCLYAFDLARIWLVSEKPAFGKIEGTDFLRKDLSSKLMLDRLALEPRGVVIERPKKDSFTNSACLPLFAGHIMWLGWLGHEQLWRGYRDDLPQRQERLYQFYNGEMKEPVNWLRAQGIDYAIWFQPDDTPDLWAKVDQALEPDYIWVEIFTAADGKKTGLWKAAPISH